MLTELEGAMGQGKSLTAVALSITEQQETGRKIFANMHLFSCDICPRCGLPHRILSLTKPLDASPTSKKISLDLSPEEAEAIKTLIGGGDEYIICNTILSSNEGEDDEDGSSVVNDDSDFPGSDLNAEDDPTEPGLERYESLGNSAEDPFEIFTVNPKTAIRVNYEYLTPERFYAIFKMAQDGELILEDCIFIIDEGYIFFSARTSGSKMNRVFNSFGMQTRKRGVDCYITTHSLKKLDVQIREAIDIRIRCRFDPETFTETLRIRDMHSNQRRRLRIDGSVFFGFYDTREIVIPPGKLYSLSGADLHG